MKFYPRLGLHHHGDCISIGTTELIWQTGSTTRRVPWSEIRLVRTSERGATLQLSGDSIFIPNDYVNFEDIVEEIREQAKRANPEYEEVPSERPLALPEDHKRQVAYAFRAQRYYEERFPSYSEFADFLRANLHWVFNEGSYYECAMSMCSGAPVGEGYSTDIDKDPPDWFCQFQKKAGSGCHTGEVLLQLLGSLQP